MGNLEFRVLKKVRCVHFIGTGNITFESLINRITELQNHPDSDPSFNVFIDFENAVLSFKDEGFDLYFSFFQELEHTEIHRKWAIYTTDEMTLTTANMHHLVLSGIIEAKVFSVRKMALAFLGITPKDLADY